MRPLSLRVSGQAPPLPARRPAGVVRHERWCRFLRQLQTAQENSNGIFSGALASMLSGVEERPLATLYLNLNSPIVRRLVTTTDPELGLASMARVLCAGPAASGATPPGAASSRP